MDSNLLKIGTQCFFSSCGLVDFLPVICPECKQSFCSNHIAMELHKCTAAELHLSQLEPTPNSSKPLRRCDFEGCRKPSLQVGNGPETCLACQKSFCTAHRHLDSHKCPSLTDTQPLKIKVTPSSGLRPKVQTRLRRLPSDPVKLAQWQKMELMKMRHRAIPGDPKDKMASPPLEQRIHVKILVDDTEKVFWLRKTVVTGRALDLLVPQLSLHFDRNQAFTLNKIAAESEALVPLRNDQLLFDQIADGTTLVLSPAV